MRNKDQYLTEDILTLVFKKYKMKSIKSIMSSQFLEILHFKWLGDV